MPKKDPTAQARAVRAARAAVLDKLREGRIKLRKTLLDPPDSLQGASIYLVLISTQGMGPQTAKSVLLESKVWPLLPLNHLSYETRKRIVENLPERIH